MAISDDVTAEKLGQPVEVEDANALDQCFDWAFLACDRMGIPRSAIRHAAAAQIWFSPTPDTDTYFDRVANTPDYVPPPNAIAVFGYLVGQYGHVAWGLTGSDRYNLQTSDQNWNNHSYIERVNHTNYYGAVGFLVPKSNANQPIPAPTAVDKPTQDNEGVVNGAYLRGHTSPNQSTAVQWYFDDNEHITIVARITNGQNITDGPYSPSKVWYLVHGNDANAEAAGCPQVWVSDAYVRTTKNPANVPDYQPANTDTTTPDAPSYSLKPVGGLWFADLSSFNGSVDFNALKAAGVEGVILRAGHVGKSFGGGDHNTDTKLLANQAGARAAGLLVAYYWYGYPALTAQTEAADFIASIGALQAGESLWLDLEEQAEGVDTKTWAAAFMKAVEAGAGRPCHLYSFYDYVQNRVDLGDLLTGNRVLWLANFNNTPGIGIDNRLEKPVGHQYWNQGKLQGVTGNVDLSLFFETADEFKALATPFTNPDPEPGKPDGEQEGPSGETPIPNDPNPTNPGGNSMDPIESLIAYARKAVTAFVIASVITLLTQNGLDPNVTVKELLGSLAGGAVTALGVYYSKNSKKK